MRRGKIIAIAVVVVMISTSLYFYFTTYNPPLQQKWAANLGETYLGNSIEDAAGNGNYYILGTNNFTGSNLAGFTVKAINMSTGELSWSLPIKVTTFSGWDITGQSYNLGENNFPIIKLMDDTLYFVSYYNNYTVGHFSGNSSKTSVLMLKINPSDGSVSKTTTLNFSFPPGLDLNIQNVGGTLYVGYQSIYALAVNTTLVAANISTGKVIWNYTTLRPLGNYNSLPTLHVLPSSEYVGLFHFNGKARYINILAASNGSLVSRIYPGNVTFVSGDFENRIVYEVSKNGTESIGIDNLVTNRTELISTGFPASQYDPAFLTVTEGVIVAAYNAQTSVSSSVSAFSFSGKNLWNRSIPYAYLDNYQSGFMPYGPSTLLYWSFSGNFNYFQVLNSTTGHQYWSRSYRPASSLIDRPGETYQPLMIYEKTVIYKWDYGNDLMIGAGTI